MVATRFPVDESLVLQFARAVGDPNPVYADAASARARGLAGILAPPTFAMAADHFDPDYTRRPRPGTAWFGSGRTASGAPSAAAGQSTGFHAEQVFTYHRHAFVGDVLAGRERPGARWEKQGRRGGVLRFRETITDYVDATGAPVLSATFVGVSTERIVDDAPSAPTVAPEPEPAAPGSSVHGWSVERLGGFVLGATRTQVLVGDLTRTQLAMYAGASGDFHPLHHDATFATSMGFPGIFAHGMLTMGMTSRLVTDVVGDATLRRWSARFLGTVWPGDALTAEATVVGLADGDDPVVQLTVRTINQHGAPVLTGTAEARIAG